MSLEVSLRHPLGGVELDVAFATGDGAVTALFGPSGAGKTSIVNAVAGLLTPREGRIALDGEVLFDSAAGINLPARKRGIGYVFQDARLFPHLSVERNLLYGWRRRGKGADRRQIEHVVDLLGIGGLLERRPHSLSGGERQRVALGRTLLARPRLLLLDEPLAALDAARQGEILTYLERIRDEDRIPMLYVSHSVAEVARLADSVVMLDQGRIVAEGAVGEVFSSAESWRGEDASDVAAVFTAVVDRHDEAYGLTHLRVPEGQLSVPRIKAEAGASVRLRIRAADVAIALTPPESYSANNVLAAVVSDIRTNGSVFADVQLSAGEHRFLARITRYSADRLKLAVGRSVFAIIKSVQIER